MKHLVMVGASYLDTILGVPHFPEEDSKLRASSLTIRRGGNCGNSLEVLQQFLYQEDGSNSDVRPHLVTVLPNQDCAATNKIISSFGPDTPVDFSHCIYRHDQTEAASCYIIRSEATDSRTIINHNALAEMTVEEFVRIADAFEDEEDETWWHFEGRVPKTTLRCVQHLRCNLPRSRISIEVEKPGRAGLRELAAEADVVFYSRSWAEEEGYPDAEACLRGEVVRSRASFLLCTWGADGAFALSPPTGECVHASAPAVSRVVDAIGAGDTFAAGILYGSICHTEDWSVRSKVVFAAELASAKVQMEGFQGLVAAATLSRAEQLGVLGPVRA